MTAPERIWATTNGIQPSGGAAGLWRSDTPCGGEVYVRADLAAIQPAQVRIKPLVWEEPCYTNNWIHVARSVLGDYYISIDGGRHSAWLEANVKPYENKIGDDVGSAIEAMMMAETDYQARMQPLITPHPDPRGDVIARLVDALHTISGDIQINADGEEELSDAARIARAALAAAKAVMK